MTTQNATNRLTQRIILSMPYDPGGVTQASINSQNSTAQDRAAGTDDYSVQGRTLTALTSMGLGTAKGPKPQFTETGSTESTNTGQLPVNLEIEAADHWQDFVPDIIMERTMGHADNKENTAAMSMANEFELDCEVLTHTFQTTAGVLTLPGITSIDPTSIPDPRQLNNWAMDLGMNREIISCKGIIWDMDTHPSNTSGHHLRRQHLLDIARCQWANVHNFNRSTGFEWDNPNRLPALTIGPKYGIGSGTHKDSGYYGHEPSNDIRGREIQASYDTYMTGANPRPFTAAGLYQGRDFPIPLKTFTNAFSYEGRRRYRGVMRKVSTTALAGQPNIWRFSFEFEVVKNELQQRLHDKIREDQEIVHDGVAMVGVTLP